VIWEEEILALLEVLYWNTPGQTSRKRWNLRAVCIAAEIRNEVGTSQQYLLTDL